MAVFAGARRKYFKKYIDMPARLKWSESLTFGQIAQLVERRTENPCVPGSIPGLATISYGFPRGRPFFLRPGAGSPRGFRRLRKKRRIGFQRGAFAAGCFPRGRRAGLCALRQFPARSGGGALICRRFRRWFSVFSPPDPPLSGRGILPRRARSMRISGQCAP